MKLPGPVMQGRLDQDSLFIHPQQLLKPLRAGAAHD
jgi:hypothetical protein